MELHPDVCRTRQVETLQLNGKISVANEKEAVHSKHSFGFIDV
jgi:hypothetical protein